MEGGEKSLRSETVGWRSPSDRPQRNRSGLSQTRSDRRAKRLTTSSALEEHLHHPNHHHQRHTDVTTLLGSSLSTSLPPHLMSPAPPSPTAPRTGNGGGGSARPSNSTQPNGAERRSNAGTIQTLCPEDKARVARLISELGSVSAEKRHTIAEMAIARRKFETELAALSQKQKDATDQNHTLQSQLATSETQLAGFRAQLTAITTTNSSFGSGTSDHHWVPRSDAAVDSSIYHGSVSGGDHTSRHTPVRPPAAHPDDQADVADHPLSSTRRSTATAADMSHISTPPHSQRTGGHGDYAAHTNGRPAHGRSEPEGLPPWGVPSEITVQGVRYTRYPVDLPTAYSRENGSPRVPTTETRDAAIATDDPPRTAHTSPASRSPKVTTSSVEIQCDLLQPCECQVDPKVQPTLNRLSQHAPAEGQLHATDAGEVRRAFWDHREQEGWDQHSRSGRHPPPGRPAPPRQTADRSAHPWEQQPWQPHGQRNAVWGAMAVGSDQPPSRTERPHDPLPSGFEFTDATHLHTSLGEAVAISFALNEL